VYGSKEIDLEDDDWIQTNVWGEAAVQYANRQG
jgi:hypothetical protein